jgi:hypothetical protein
MPVIARLVVVAAEVVERSPVKFWRVDDEVTSKLRAVNVPVAVRLVAVRVPATIADDEA